jgi:hypothetical protein
VFPFQRRTEQALFLLVLLKDYGATRSGGAAKLGQVDQTAPKARDMKELRDKTAEQSAKARNMKELRDKIAKQSAKGAKYERAARLR